MSRHNQIDLLSGCWHFVDTKTTAMADAPWRNDVSVYTDPQRFSSEQRILFPPAPDRDGIRLAMACGRQLQHR